MHKQTIVGVFLLTLAACWAELSPKQVRAINPQSQGSGASAPGPKAAMPELPKTADLVVLVSIDGLRPDVITPDTRALHKLYLRGASPHDARTIDKSATLPSHASMVSGVELEKHGIDFNAYRPERGMIRKPTIFSVVSAHGLPSSMFVGKSKLRHLLAKPSDAAFKMAGMQCGRLVRNAMPALQEARRGVMFLHFADPDSAGHRHGWMTDEYMEAVQHADHCLEKVMNTLEESGRIDRTLLIVTSDHGGHKRSHGTRLLVDKKIPWFAWGAGVRRGRFREPVRTTDTAATVLAALGLRPPEGMQGRPVAGALAASLGPSGLSLVGAPVERGNP